MTLIAQDDVFDFLELSIDDNSIATTIHSSVEKFVSNYCRRTFEATDYKEWYSGAGSQRLLLKNYPVINVKRVSLGIVTAMQIYNTNKYTSAVVTITSTGLNLEYNDVAVAQDLTFATNTTLTTLASAVNSIGNGWVANVLDDYGTVLSTELLERPGQSAINSTYVDLIIPSLLPLNVSIDSTSGIIYLPSNIFPYITFSETGLYVRDYTNFVEANDGRFSMGFNNIFVKYRAGYEEDNVPDDLKLAILMMIKDLYSRHQEDSIGMSSYSVSSVISKQLDSRITEKALPILNLYKRPLV